MTDGTYSFSGISEFSTPDMWGENTIEGIHIILNDEVYEAYYDPSDGYRSYGVFRKAPEIPVTEVKFRFPPQLVEVRNIKDEQQNERGYCTTDYEGTAIFDAKNGKLILEVGTDYADNYYPCGNYSYTPENLSINEGR